MAADTWYGDPPPPHQSPDLAGWGRVVLRGVPLVLVIVVGLLLTLVLHPIERIFSKGNRLLTPFVTVAVCRIALKIIGIRHRVSGHVMQGGGAFVANHATWLDIFALNATARLYFVSKAEVAGWPGIGWLAKATGTVFIQRDRKQAAAQVGVLKDRLAAGHKLLFFPEGTSTDGQRVLPFKPTLFAAFLAPELRDEMQVQPVTVRYTAPEGQDARFYGWWGNMDLAPHLLQMLAQQSHGQVKIILHPPVNACEFADRKAMAKALQQVVTDGFDQAVIAERRSAKA